MGIKVFIIEEQEVYREAFRSSLTIKPTIEVLGMCGVEGLNQMDKMIHAFKPDVLLVGVKTLRSDTVEEIIQIRKANPVTGIMLGVMNYDIKNIETLRRSLSGRRTAGIAFFCKQSIDNIDQLCEIISGVSRQEVIIDRWLTAMLAGRTKSEELKELTARELEILSLLSMGYTNLAIAEALIIDVKTVKHHINNMYSKLNLVDDSKDRHARVSAARMYFAGNGMNKSTGLLNLGETDL